MNKLLLLVIPFFILDANLLEAIPAAQITVKVNLKDQMLYIAKDGAPIFSTPVETGKPQTPTLFLSRSTYFISILIFWFDFPFNRFGGHYSPRRHLVCLMRL